MRGWKLPTTITVAGREYEIRTDREPVLDVLAAMTDDEIFEPGMSDSEKSFALAQTMLVIMVPDYEQIPIEHWGEATKAICEFIDCGLSGDDAPKHKLMDWTQDAPILAPAMNKVAGQDVRTADYIHWWTFLGYYLEIGESLFSSIVAIRQKKKSGKKLSKEESKFYRENKSLIDLREKKRERSEAEKAALRDMFGMKER